MGEAKTSATSLAAFESELGAQPPLGFFDPLGLLDEAGQTRFDRLRYVEIKHGRICQLAFLGNIIPRVFQFPGTLTRRVTPSTPTPRARPRFLALTRSLRTESSRCCSSLDS